MAKTNYSLVDLAAEALIRDLQTALSTPVRLLETLAEHADLDHGFRMKDEERLIKAWTSAGVPAEKLLNTVNVLRHIHRFGISNDKPVSQLLIEIKELCAKHQISGLPERENILGRLFTASDQYRLIKTYLPWAKSVFPNLVGLDANVELRASYDSNESSDLTGLIPLVVFRLAYRFDDDKEEQTRRVALQLTEESLEKLLQTLERAKRRLAGLKQEVRDVERIVELPRIEVSDGE